MKAADTWNSIYLRKDGQLTITPIAVRSRKNSFAVPFLFKILCDATTGRGIPEP